MNEPSSAPHLDEIDRSEGDTNQTSRRGQWQEAFLQAETRQMLEADEAVFLRQCLSTPCLNAVSACEGIYLIDAEGRRIMDFHGNYVHQVGYRHPEVIDAIKRQLETLPFSPRRYTNRPAIELAERLAELTPGDLGKSLFVPGGAEAIGVALQLARVATGRYKTVSMWGAFHGATMEAASVGGEALFRANIGPLMAGTHHVPPSGARACVFGCEGTCSLRCADYVEYVLDQERDIAAVIAEPIRASNVTIPHPDYWKKVRAACDRHGALLIFDEIPTGLGRTGDMFASKTVDVCPDILVLGKGLGGGVWPLAAVVARRDLDVARNRALGHYTHEKTPVGAAAALATLNILQRDSLPARARELGAKTVDRIEALRKSLPCIGGVRNTGLLMGVDIVMPGDPAQPDDDLADAILYESLSRGLSYKLGGGNTLVLCPPLTITDDEMDRALEILGDAIRAAVGNRC